MAREWTDEEVQKEIADAIAIVREDRFETFVRGRIGQADPDKNGGKDQSGNTGNGDGNDPNAPKKSRSLWWGESE